MLRTKTTKETRATRMGAMDMTEYLQVRTGDVMRTGDGAHMCRCTQVM